GAGFESPLVKLCVLLAAPLLLITTADATLRIWRSAWAWMPVDRNRGLFRLAWVGGAAVFLALIVGGVVLVLGAGGPPPPRPPSAASIPTRSSCWDRWAAASTA